MVGRDKCANTYQPKCLWPEDPSVVQNYGMLLEQLVQEIPDGLAPGTLRGLGWVLGTFSVGGFGESPQGSLFLPGLLNWLDGAAKATAGKGGAFARLWLGQLAMREAGRIF